MRIRWHDFFVGLFLVIGIIATIFIIRSYGLHEIIRFYNHVNWMLLSSYFLTICVLFAVLTWRWSVILRSRGHHIAFSRLFVYRLIGSAINFFTPGPRVGGEPTQASLIARHGVEFTEGLSTVMIDKIIDATTCGLLFIIGAALVSIYYVIPGDAKIYMMCGSAIFVIATLLFYYRMLIGKHFFLKIFHFFGLEKSENTVVRRIEEAIIRIETIMIQFYKHDRATFILSVIITLISWVVMFAEYKLATTLLGLHLGFVQLFFIIAFVGIAVLFPIPMAVGVLEASQISAFSIIGVPVAAGVALAFLVRMKDLTFSIIGLILLAFFGFNVPQTIEQKYKK